MKKTTNYLILVFALILILSLTFISAGVFSDFWNKATGKATEELGSTIFQSNCYDSDGMNYYVKGYRNFQGVIEWDSCLSTGLATDIQTHVAELYCYGVSSKECEFGCVDGACMTESYYCNDSDGGSLYIKGIKNSSSGGLQEDFCVGEDMAEVNPPILEGPYLYEYDCNGDFLYECPNGCVDGACIGQGSARTKDLKNVTNCSDTDGINYYIKGTRNYNGEIDEDVCIYISDLDGDHEFIKEYYCVGEKNFKCKFGCVDGACVINNSNQSFCVDSDGGQFPYEFGTVSLNGNSYQDYCVESDAPGKEAVIEYFCENETVEFLEINCFDGDVCLNGACFEVINYCNDSDGGFNVNLKGTVSVTDNLGNVFDREDYCVDENGVPLGDERFYLMENYCVGDGSASIEFYDCVGNSYEPCNDGACVGTGGGSNIKSKLTFFQKIGAFFKSIF